MFTGASGGSVCVSLLVLFCFPPAGLASDQISEIATHGNTRGSGVMKGQVLTLNLVVTEGEWHPEAENGPHIPVYAFAEEGKAPAIPGPLIRVPEGTRIQANVRNVLGVPIAVHGFSPRGSKDEPVVLTAGEQHKFDFSAGLPGTYYYWAGPPGAALVQRLAEWSQLSGAFIVDERGSQPSDRVFVIGLWRSWEDREHLKGLKQFGVINGKSWPYTERLSFHVGERARWRWINTTAGFHPMHMHGSYYQVVNRGDGESYQPLTPELRPRVVTELLLQGHTMATIWQPKTPGHWLFHCHLMAHLDPKSSLSAIQGKNPVSGHQHSDMVGLVMALDVLGPSANKEAAYRQARRLTLVIDEKRTNPLEVKLSLLEGKERLESQDLEGPPIVLRRGEAAEITVVNHLAEPTSIHWHGMELESYYDGVPNFTGMGKRLTPLIPPGGEFMARMTPPRAGTFIYHTHWHDIEQLQGGLHGPLLVVEPGKYQPDSEQTFIAAGAPGETNVLLVNGTKTPAPLEWRAGKTYHLRLINISPNLPVTFILDSGSKSLTWRAVSKDGMALPPSQQTLGKAIQLVAIGETYEFETETRPEDLRMRANVAAAPGIIEEQTIELPIRVR